MSKCFVIALDFDGTLVEDKFPAVGKPKMETINMIKALSDTTPDLKIILWTCRNGEYLTSAVEFCKAHGIRLDAVNENLPEVRALYGGGDTRKVMADIYLDDKAVHPTDFLSSLAGLIGEPPA